MKRTDMKEMMKLVGIIVFGAVCLLNMDKGMEVLSVIMEKANLFLAERRDLLDRICDIALIGTGVGLLFFSLKELTVVIYESFQDEESFLFKVAFIAACIILFVPVQVYKVMRRAYRRRCRRRKGYGK